MDFHVRTLYRILKNLLHLQSKLLMTYKHLSQAERYQIYALMKAGHDQSQSAKLLDRHKSAISRELRRNSGSQACCHLLWPFPLHKH
jgi:hypothetical protein